MKKFAFAFAIVAALVVALLATGNVSAQGTTPPTPPAPGTGYGNGGPMGGRGARGGFGGAAVNEGILHDGMIAVYAEKLGISVDDLNARLAGGETIAQIAAEKGLTAEQFNALMAEARSQAIDQAVKAGALTQEQADWLKQRGGLRNGTNGGTVRGRGMRGNAVDCPYFPQTNP